MNLLGPFDGKDEMVIAETVEGLDGSLGILFSLVTDKSKAAGLTGDLVLGEENTRDFSNATKELLEIRIPSVLRKVCYTNRAALIRCKWLKFI